MTITYSDDRTPSAEELVELYDALGWSAYTRDPQCLAAAVAASLRVVTAHDEDGLMVGLARVVGDGLTIVYLQDILVRPDRQRRGVGRGLFSRVLAPYDDVRQKVLLTDGEPAQRAFYEAMGFTEIRDLTPSLRSFVRFDV